MSIEKWRKWAEEKSKLDEQTEEIHQKFKMDKINKEFGQLSGEEFFRPITKRLDDEKSSTTVEEEEQEVPDYTMDEFDEINPFGDEFRPDEPTPAPSAPTTPTKTTTPIEPTSLPPPYQEFDDLPLPPPPLMEETVMPGSSKDETREETSKHLRNVKSILAKHGSDPTYKVKSKGSKYYGYNVEELEAEAFKLETIKEAPYSFMARVDWARIPRAGFLKTHEIHEGENKHGVRIMFSSCCCAPLGSQLEKNSFLVDLSKFSQWKCISAKML